MSKLLLPLDGSALAESAISLAAALARRLGGEISLLHVVQTPDLSGSVISGAETYLDGVVEAIRQRYGLAAERSVAFGIAATVILETAEREGVSLIVLSTRGRTGLLRAVLGSVAEEVLREAAVPVFLVPAAASVADPPPLARILVPLDGSEVAHAIVGPLAELVGPLGAEVMLLQAAPGPAEFTDSQGRIARAVVEPAERVEQAAREYLAAVQAELTAVGIRAQCLYRLGKPADVIVAAAEAQAADAIALTTHGRSGLDRLRHGSVAEAVLRQSPVPVLVLGRAAIRRHWLARRQAAGGEVDRSS